MAAPPSIERMRDELVPQELWNRMQAVADDLNSRFGENVTITVDDSHNAGFRFAPIAGCSFGLFDAVAWIDLEIDSFSKEFPITSDGFAHCLDHIEAVVAGRVTAVRGGARSELTAQTSHGLVAISGDTYANTLRTTPPGWRIWGVKTTYPAWPAPPQG